MNIFKYYLKNKQKHFEIKIFKIKDFQSLNNVNLEIPPQQYNFDLSKRCFSFIYIKINPRDLGTKIKSHF